MIAAIADVCPVCGGRIILHDFPVDVPATATCGLGHTTEIVCIDADPIVVALRTRGLTHEQIVERLNADREL